MKGHTSVLLDIAKSDLDLAKKALPDDPANAAFHAQQCSEKAVKAMAFELGPYKEAKDFDPMVRRKLRHDSTYVCSDMLRIMIECEISDFEKELARLKLSKEEGNPGAQIAYVLGMSFKLGLQQILKALESSPVEDTEDNWIRSLDPNLIPKPEITRKFKADFAEGMSNMESVGKTMAPFLVAVFGIEKSVADQLLDPSTDISQMLNISEQFEQVLRGRGMIDEASQIQAVRTRMAHLLGPNHEFVSWLTLVGDWTYYLDLNAVRGRYQDAVQRKAYREHVDGVRTWVCRAGQILKQTQDAIPLLSAN
jgi:HEPN domain-containing protein